ncbi:ubiquitin-associated domain-containing protein 1 isoform X2 [Condylostylus longicornis]|uniref:ubiquitin-associated domain-containing protein 1 isoform X2 n=1 Tax=Condylostylus longicornis TaxID=2530218 RepID=UPI00244DF130|nr:ubiquitin-associated domain-containing protein 1 isoform X2 [Condylostylus longicornis]
MIPWVRKWVNSRKQRNDNNNTSSLPSAPSPSVAGSSSNNYSHQQEQTHQQQQSQKLTASSSSPNHISRREERQKYSKLKNPSNINQRRSKDLDLKEKIRIRVLIQNGRSIFIDAFTSKKLLELKNEILIELSSDSCALPLYATDIKQLTSRYRLTRPDSAGIHQTDMQEDKTLAQLGIQNNETLVLSVKRTNIQRSVDQYQAPRVEEIEQATRNIPHPTREFRRVDINELVAQSDFDVRKVLISLAQESAYIIGAGPYAPRLISMLKQKLINKRRHQSDTLQCLVDMGFSKEKAIYALKLHNGVYSSALEWLIQHQSEQELTSIEDSITHLSASSNTQIIPSKLSQTNSIVDNIEALLEIVRIYSYRDVPPQPHVVSSLIEMGFSEADVREALRKTHNNQAAACEWLCGNRNASLLELREGLSHESPILKAMMQSPQVQISLSNPKIFIAYLSMLENQNALSMWLGDSDTSTIISHILRKYHEEKHILGINQFNLPDVR